MRMRRKKHGAERLAAQAHLLLTCPETPVSDPSAAFFGRNCPCALEIGCGKGGFACGMAELHPDTNFIGLERVSNVMVIAVEQAASRASARTADNLRFCIGDADALRSWFMPQTLDGIYLNFSDPWPKNAHAKRRLTHRNRLALYLDLLKDGGSIAFKTDNVGLFDFTLEECDALGLTPDYVTRDLHASEYADGNVMTEYERNFSSQGIPICALRLTVKH